MKFAYADPTYIGMAFKYKCEEMDHEKLIQRLVKEYPDGWALSCHTPSLKEILNLCPDDVRIMAWVKPFASFKPGMGVAYTWEPVIVRGGRKRKREQRTVRDYVACNITLKRGFTGAKPEGFCFWLFEILNIEPEDEFHDLFYGSGAVTRAWEKWKEIKINEKAVQLTLIGG